MGATPQQTVISRLEQAGKQPRQHGNNWTAKCPAHDDTNPSLSISPGTEPDQILMHCHAGCTIDDITAALGMTPKDLYASKPSRTSELVELEQYTYQNADGTPVMRVHRYQPKTFRQSSWTGSTWTWGTKGVEPVLYRLPQVIQAIQTGETIYIVEGERDVHTLETLGLTATTNAGGAGKFRDTHAQQLVGASLVIVIADNDTVGIAHAQAVMAELSWIGIVSSLKYPADGCKDATDHIAAGHQIGHLKEHQPDKLELVAEPALTGWEKTDLSAVLSVDYTPPTPSICKRTDGKALFYAGRVNALFGESGSGKSWLAMETCAQEIKEGNNVIYIDHEDHAGSVVARVIKLGCTTRQIIEHFAYIRPDRAWNRHAAQTLALDLASQETSLVVCDSTGEGMSLDGVDPNSDDGVAKWMRDFARHLANLGPCVLLLDHMPKSSEANKAFMIGSQRKKAAIDGAAYRVETIIAPAKGLEGKLRLVTAKDRGGYYQHGAQVADITIVDVADAVELTILPPSSGMRDDLLEAICAELQDGPRSLTRIRAVTSAATGQGFKSQIVDRHTRWLHDNGNIQISHAGNTTIHTLIMAFESIRTTPKAPERDPVPILGTDRNRSEQGSENEKKQADPVPLFLPVPRGSEQGQDLPCSSVPVLRRNRVDTGQNSKDKDEPTRSDPPRPSDCI